MDLFPNFHRCPEQAVVLRQAFFKSYYSCAAVVVVVAVLCTVLLCCVPCLRIEIDLPLLLFPNESVSFSAGPAAFSHRGCLRPDVGHLRMCIARVFMHVG